MLKALRAAVATGKVIPVLAAAATKSIGSYPLLDLLIESFPSPADRGEVEGIELKSKAPGRRAPDPKAPMAALVFKTVSDPHVGKLSIFRLYSGAFKSDSQVYNASKEARERVGQVAWLQGKTQKAVEALGPGESGVGGQRKETLGGGAGPRRGGRRADEAEV